MPRNAFSLVELSIVLVILGLLTGGILGGQALIRAAEIRAHITDSDRYRAAIHTFRDKYFMLPGDMNNAVSFWGSLGGTGSDATCQNGTATSTATCNGNGDGYVSTSAVSNDERWRFFQHLANAGLIEGRYTGRTTGADATFEYILGTNVPNLKGTTTFTSNYSSVGTGAAGSYQFPGDPAGHRLELRGTDGGTQPLKPEETWNIDTKMDDGRPAYGLVLAPMSSWSGSTGCTTSDAVTAEYSLSTTSKICRFNVRF